MKKNVIFFLLTLLYVATYAQSPCADSQIDVNYAYSHAKSSYDANNLSQLKRFANRSLEAFKRVESSLETCGCDDAYNEAYNAIEALTKIETIDIYEDARFYIKRARENAKQAMSELENCTKWSDEDHALAELQDEQNKLEEQRRQLQLKQEQIKKKLANQKVLENRAKKESFIAKNEDALNGSINAFNDMLSACGCDSQITRPEINTDNILENDISQIKTMYLNKVREITASYLVYLNQCSIKQP